MNVKQLIEELENMDPQAEVYFVCDYGDYHHTQQAMPVEVVGDGDNGELADSNYSQSGTKYVERDGSPTEYYCEACDEMTTRPCCPACGAVCVTEDGEPADVSNTERDPIVILQ